MKIKKLFLMAIVMMLAFPSLPLAADSREKATEENGEYSSKDEVVYAKLTPNGNQLEMYIVNNFEITKAGTITDYGSYTSLKNLTDTSEIQQDGDKVTFTAQKGKFFYQGNMKHQPLPWNFDISYALNGRKMNVENMLGQDGNLNIEIKTSANKQADEVFFENYLMQISINLDSNIYQNIKAKDGTIANAGKDKQVTFTVMPGKEAEFTLDAEVTDFEFEGIEIAAIPSTMAIDFPDTDEMTDDMETLSDAIGTVNDGVSQFKDGISELNSGISSLEDGSSQYKDGISVLDKTSIELVDASKSMNDALTAINESIKNDNPIQLDEMDTLDAGLKQLAEGLFEIKDQLTTLREGYVTAYETLDSVMEGLPSVPMSDEDIQSLLGSNADSEVVQQLLDVYEKAFNAKVNYDQLQEGLLTVDGALKGLSESMEVMGNKVNRMRGEISDALEELDLDESISHLQEGLQIIASHYESFHDGLVTYTEGVSQLANSYTDIHSGITGVSKGTTDLNNGASDLSQGTNELHESTSNLPEEMQEEIDKMLEEYDTSDFEAISFVSTKNDKKINTVQFVLKTESVKKEETKPEKTEKTEEKGFWERLLDLFR